MKAAGLAIAAALLAVPAAAQALYKCVQPNGRVLYQDSRCEDNAKQSTVRNPDTPPALPLPPGDERRDAAPEASVASVVQALSTYQGCSQDVPGFATKHRAAFDEWKLLNAAAMARYGRDERAQERVRESLQEQLRAASTDPQAREERAYACEKDAVTMFAPPKPRP